MAAEIIRNHGIVAFPTETVYGLGASVFDEVAIERVFRAKGRPNDNPLIAHISKISQIRDLAIDVNRVAKQLIETFFPGALTIILKKTENVPIVATAGLETIAVRMPASVVARELIEFAGVPLVAPSANLSGRPSPTNWRAVLEDLDGKIDCILKGETSEFGIESTVVDTTTKTPLILRQGAVTLEMIRELFPYTKVLDEREMTPARSPGLRHQHYSPDAKVILIDSASDFQVGIGSGGETEAYIGLKPFELDFERQLICSDVEEYASLVFEFFRQCDRAGVKRIYCESVDEKGIGAALIDRLRRASER